MKRKPEVKSSAKFGDILQATTLEQRAWIGAVVLAYNEAEGALHKLAGSCLGYIGIGPTYTITARINGTEGLIAIIKQAVDGLKLSADLFNATLAEEGFGKLKPMRDAVIHAELFDTSTDIALAPGKRGERQEVLLSPDALEGLYKRLVFLAGELRHLELIINCAKALKLLPLFDALDDQRRLHNEQDIQDATTRCLSRQQQRRSLPPFPKFPEPPEPSELLSKWLASTEATRSLRIHGDDFDR